MSRIGSPLGFVVALFDVMGFQSRLEKYGLDEIHMRYMKIVEFVNRNSEKNDILINKLNITAPILTADGPPFSVYDVRATYASDSILVWANLAWRMVQSQSAETLKINKNHPAFGYMSFPVPLRTFFEICAEIICIGIEFDLPLRGAVSMGDAVLDEKNGIYLGEPLVDSARLENKQNCIGLSLCNSFQIQPETINCLLPYTLHLKEEILGKVHHKFAFNWPEYWRATRPEKDVRVLINEMSKKNNNHEYYTNTLKLVEFSENFRKQ